MMFPRNACSVAAFERFTTIILGLTLAFCVVAYIGFREATLMVNKPDIRRDFDVSSVVSNPQTTVLIRGVKHDFPHFLKYRKNSVYMPVTNWSDPIQMDAFTSALDSLNVECILQRRVGDITDGGWDVCLAPPYNLQTGCLVYDFGINDEWTFDDSVARDFGCTVRAFDPTMGVGEHDRTSNIHFYPVGLAGENTEIEILNQTCTVRTLGTLMKRFGEENAVIDYLKIDIEMSEWSAMENMLQEGFLSKQVKQIGLEIHMAPFHSPKDFNRYQEIFKGMERQGFWRWKSHWNRHTIYHHEGFGYASYCHELYFININWLKANS